MEELYFTPQFSKHHYFLGILEYKFIILDRPVSCCGSASWAIRRDNGKRLISAELQ
jgi:hypothetical protein